MSLPNTFDSQQVASPSSTQQLTQEVIIQNGNVTNRHLTYAQIRGVIQIFNHHFPKKGKRMSKDERNRRWLMYKNKIFQEYGRVITGKLDSEKAYVKRYSKPLDFLKYKLKRTQNLKIEDLPNEADKDYYFEIGGIEDVEKLKKQTYDINYDSVHQITNNFENYNNNRKRKRRRIEGIVDNIDSNIDQNHNHNHNHNNNNNNANDNRQQPQIIVNEPRVGGLSSVPPALAQNQPQRLKREPDVKVDEALLNISGKMDVFEQEMLDKKKIEMYEITKQKMNAMKTSMETHFINDPHLIGCIPGIEQQDSIAFDCWINKYKHIIKDDNQIKGNIHLLVDQLSIMRSDMTEWTNFLTKWKLNRMLYDDNFQIIWTKVKDELNIQNHEQYELLEMSDELIDKNDEKEECD